MEKPADLDLSRRCSHRLQGWTWLPQCDGGRCHGGVSSERSCETSAGMSRRTIFGFVVAIVVLCFLAAQLSLLSSDLSLREGVLGTAELPVPFPCASMLRPSTQSKVLFLLRSTTLFL